MTINKNERLKYLRKKLNISQKELASELMLNVAMISLIENNKKNLTDKNIILICEKFNINANWLKFGEGEIFKESEDDELLKLSNQYNLDTKTQTILKNFLNMNDDDRNMLIDFMHRLVLEQPEETQKSNQNIDTEYSDELLVIDNTKEYITLRVYDQCASAGTGYLSSDNTCYSEEQYELNEVTSQADHVVTINGDSMYPTFTDGQQVFVKEQPVIDNNDIGIFILNDEVYCKRYHNDGTTIKLVSDNKEYNDIIISKPDVFKVVGKVLI